VRARTSNDVTVKPGAGCNLKPTIDREASMMTSPKMLEMKAAVSRAARRAGALFCALAFGLSAGAAHAQTMGAA
jgi:hypothetical protein